MLLINSLISDKILSYELLFLFACIMQMAGFRFLFFQCLFIDFVVLVQAFYLFLHRLHAHSLSTNSRLQ